MINGKQLKYICPTMSQQRADEVAAILDNICPQYGINTPDIFHEFIANVAEECGEFTVFEENLWYSVSRLREVWPNRFPTVESAIPYSKNPRSLANRVYSDRLGNIQPNDGYDFRGSGPIQITGRRNMTMWTVYYNRRFGTNYTITQMAALLRTDLTIGINSACWIFAIAFKLIDEAIADDMKSIVKRINGGFTNVDKRMAYYERAKKIVI